MKTWTYARLSAHSALVASCLAVSAFAQAGEFEDYARVVSVAPQVERFNQPRQECRTEHVQVQRQQRGSGDASGGIIGGIAGGILGNQVGGGNGKTVATAVGAITGALVGDRMQNGETVTTTETQPVQRCRTVDQWEQRTTGYVVTYEYRGHTHTAVMPYNPGDRVRLRVSASPM